MFNLKFQCANPDFTIYSIPDGERFRVRREVLRASQVFNDMFECCAPSTSATTTTAATTTTVVEERKDTEGEELGIDESADTLHILLNLLHSPPQPPTKLPETLQPHTGAQRTTSAADTADGDTPPTNTHTPSTSHTHTQSNNTPNNSHSHTTDTTTILLGLSQIKTRSYIPETIIPWPLLPSLLRLADKYILSEDLTASLHSHLLAHAPIHPMEVYGYAWRHGLMRIAAKSSRFIAPLASYSLERVVQCIPSVEAHHRVLRLQDERVRALRRILLEEEMFPFNYGLCLSHHEEARALWDRTRRKLVGRIETGELGPWD
ncbi:hypothetical protein ONZ45_g4221 [Pleurotus djamor]|nr:hypothetical protein ONZ45_g4221 [Pleurotus djamor]